MEIKKCTKCGAFILSQPGDVCSSCMKEIAYENTVLKNYFDENLSFDSISSISAITGIAPNRIQNYMQENDFIDSDMDIGNSFSGIQY